MAHRRTQAGPKLANGKTQVNASRSKRASPPLAAIGTYDLGQLDLNGGAMQTTVSQPHGRQALHSTNHVRGSRPLLMFLFRKDRVQFAAQLEGFHCFSCRNVGDVVVVAAVERVHPPAAALALFSLQPSQSLLDARV